MACHQYPPAQRGSSRVIDTSGGTVLRTVVPIHNRPACYACHDPSHRINGILILDRNVGSLRAAIDQDMVRMVGGTGLATLVLVGAIAFIVRFVVLRRLRPPPARSRRATSIAACPTTGRTRSRGSPASSTRWPTR